MEKLLSAKEVAELMGVSTETVYRWAKQGRLPSARSGHKIIRFDPKDVREFIERLKEKSQA